jgi:hypothetical protein
MPLGTVEPLAGAAVVANEYFFSHCFLIAWLGRNAKNVSKS